MFTFNVGPSQLTDNTKQDILKAVKAGVLEISHRSQVFSQISTEAIEGLRTYYKIPKDYKIFYTDSATRAMELAVENTCRKKSFHFCNGAFSNLFAKIARGFSKEVAVDSVAVGQLNDYQRVKITPDTDFITVTHNETSSGVMCSNLDIEYLRKQYPKQTLAVDITSSAGAVAFNFRDADIWFFSVQKCFGLPAGLGVIIVSPEAYEKSLEIINANNNFSFENMWAKMDSKYQTVCTPNVFNIYLLAEKLKRWNSQGGLKRKIELTQEKIKLFSEFMMSRDDLEYFVDDLNLRSDTIFYLKGGEKTIKEMHTLAEQNKIILGKGYGVDNKKIAIRLANFPAISRENLKKLFKVL